ncbi:MAG TPA: nicotinate phosphoribosyltransferase [Blastocatellia bacterium]|nr:nicotinate phosphoribosyltransferase [Blastocatellia bacterium]
MTADSREHEAGQPVRRSPGLALDLYELTMAAAYHANRRFERATFELFVRRLPPERGYLVTAGLPQAVDYLRTLRFSREETAYLQALPAFARVSPEFFDYLRDFRFTGEVHALPEGTVAFAGEPLLRVTAPIIEAQIVETYLLSTINFQTMIATKASRSVSAAQGRGVIEFGARRAHGMEAALFAARAAFIGGCIGTSNVEAGHLFDLPVYGTAAHSWTMAFETEREAFESYFRTFPEYTTFLLDTYDTPGAARLATEFGPGLRGVRLDSGDIAELSKQVRAILDAAGMQQTRIMASGDLDEYKIASLLEAGAPVDLFGVGTSISTSVDAPALGGIYKLVEIETGGSFRPTLKLSRDKATYPLRKQIWRAQNEAGQFSGDIIAAEIETPDESSNEYAARGCTPLLVPVMRDGELIAPLPGLREAQERARQQLARLPEACRTLDNAACYPVSYSPELERLRAETIRGIEGRR